MKAYCPDCPWSMDADDAEEAEVLLALHRTVKAIDSAESIVEDEAGCSTCGGEGFIFSPCVDCGRLRPS